MTTEELLENYIQLLKNGNPNLSAIKNREFRCEVL